MDLIEESLKTPASPAQSCCSTDCPRSPASSFISELLGEADHEPAEGITLESEEEKEEEKEEEEEEEEEKKEKEEALQENADSTSPVHVDISERLAFILWLAVMPIVSMIAMCVLVLSWWLFVEILGVIGAILPLLVSVMVCTVPDFEKEHTTTPQSSKPACKCA